MAFIQGFVTTLSCPQQNLLPDLSNDRTRGYADGAEGLAGVAGKIGADVERLAGGAQLEALQYGVNTIQLLFPRSGACNGTPWRSPLLPGTSDTARHEPAERLAVARLPDSTLMPDVVDLTGRSTLDSLGELRRKLAGSARPTAVLTYTGHEAWHVYRAAEVVGLRVPEDLSLIGVSDAPIRHVEVELSTLLLPEHELGRSAAGMLRELVDGTGAAMPPQAVPLVLGAETTMAPLSGVQEI